MEKICLKRFFEKPEDQREEVIYLAGMYVLYSQAAQELTDFMIVPNVESEMIPEIRHFPAFLKRYPHVFNNQWCGPLGDPVFIANSYVVVDSKEKNLMDILEGLREYKPV